MQERPWATIWDKKDVTPSPSSSTSIHYWLHYVRFSRIYWHFCVNPKILPFCSQAKIIAEQALKTGTIWGCSSKHTYTLHSVKVLSKAMLPIFAIQDSSKWNVTSLKLSKCYIVLTLFPLFFFCFSYQQHSIRKEDLAARRTSWKVIENVQ